MYKRQELDYAINVTGTENVAKAAEKHGATLVYISTDYVFDGEKPVGQEWDVYKRQDQESTYSSLDAFKGKKVAVQKGTIEEGLAKKQLKDSTVVSLTRCV